MDDLVCTFDGTNSISIESWLTEFEEQALIMCWKDVQKLIFAKKEV